MPNPSSKLLKTILFTISSIAIIFHILILTQIIDYKNAWGGQLQSLEQMYVFETFSLFVQFGLLFLIQASDYKFQNNLGNKLLTILLFGMSALMLLNTLGNTLATQPFEKFAFTPLTFIAALCFFGLGWKRTHRRGEF